MLAVGLALAAILVCGGLINAFGRLRFRALRFLFWHQMREFERLQQVLVPVCESGADVEAIIAKTLEIIPPERLAFLFVEADGERGVLTRTDYQYHEDISWDADLHVSISSAPGGSLDRPGLYFTYSLAPDHAARLATGPLSPIVVTRNGDFIALTRVTTRARVSSLEWHSGDLRYQFAIGLIAR